MKRLFGTDGIRGRAGEFPLDERTAAAVGTSLANALGEKIGRRPRIVTGRDTRESGASIEKSLHRGIAAAGASCESAGVITTPGVAFVARAFDFDAGIVVSASHNPFDDNGIKIFSPSGKKIDDATERRIEADVATGEAWSSDTPENFAVQPNDNSRDLTAAYAEALISGREGKYDAMRLVLDCANGAASNLAPQLFRMTGAEVTVINNGPDGRNINLNCGSLHLENLQKKVLAESADLGVAFDGDADRALFVDAGGQIVDGDATLWILANYLQERGGLNGQTVIATVMSNIGLEIALAARGTKLVRTPVGDKYVLDELLKTGASLGGEQSGHIIVPAESLVGDGMRTALLVLSAVGESGKSLAQLAAGFVRYPQILVNVKVKEKRPFESIGEVAELSSKIENELNGKGRLLLRYSGTENLARVMIEGENQETIESQANRLADVIKLRLG